MNEGLNQNEKVNFLECGMNDSVTDSTPKKFICAFRLFSGRKDIYILHGDEQYKLSITRQNKSRFQVKRANGRLLSQGCDTFIVHRWAQIKTF
ncbi:MAG: hemin uptake protein HemP [Gammaproteobacteria bacterium]